MGNSQARKYRFFNPASSSSPTCLSPNRSNTWSRARHLHLQLFLTNAHLASHIHLHFHFLPYPTIIFLFPVILSLLIPPISHPHPSFRISISASSSIQPSNQSKPNITPDVNYPAGTRITPFEMKRSSLRLDHDISEARIHFGLSVWIMPSPHCRGGVMVILSDHLKYGLILAMQTQCFETQHNSSTYAWV